ncbi:HlyD family secretion protein [Bradyrhizobium sp. HKCCYLRH3059]|uniref:HlyD family secretion protein n=1 Tax=Bradyrhizobium sp. HKCCYLRH3059 TaxID=3420745 RepID=UPI003EBFF836
MIQINRPTQNNLDENVADAVCEKPNRPWQTAVMRPAQFSAVSRHTKERSAMVLVMVLYIVMVWLLFSKLKLVKWGWGAGTITVVIGAFILMVFLGLFNSLTPAGRFVVISRVVEVTPNVSGQVVSIPVQVNAPVKAGAILFQIDPAPYKYKVSQLEASLAQAQQQVKQLKASYDQAKANADALKQQLVYQTQRLADIRKLVATGSQAEFRLQDTQVQYDTVQYQLLAAEAAVENARLAMESEIGGENTNVAQLQAQLENARWELDQTTIRATGDGYVSSLALAVGARALQTRSEMSFILTNDITILATFKPNAFQTVKPGATVKLVFDDNPGEIFGARILEIPRGIGQGQIAVSGQLARVGSIGGAQGYPATISLPDNLDKTRLRLGMPGSAWAIAANAGPIGMITSILVWISSYLAYL